MENIIWRGPEEVFFFVLHQKSKGISGIQFLRTCFGIERMDWKIFSNEYTRYSGRGSFKISLNFQIAINALEKPWALDNFEITELDINFVPHEFSLPLLQALLASIRASTNLLKSQILHHLLAYLKKKLSKKSSSHSLLHSKSNYICIKYQNELHTVLITHDLSSKHR
jgi:hypothetical protein